jgi:hypothetical protein
MLTITFLVTLDSQYVAQDGRTFGLVGKKVSHFITGAGASLTATTSVEFVDGADYRGDAIAGKRGERFVYFGLEQSGAWLRRWKLRHQQLDVIFGAAVSDQITVSVLLGKDVTPSISLTA